MYGSANGMKSTHGMKSKIRKYPHDMFKGSVKKIAKNEAEHMKLEKQGYTHTRPKPKK